MRSLARSMLTMKEHRGYQSILYEKEKEKEKEKKKGKYVWDYDYLLLGTTIYRYAIFTGPI